MYKSRLQELCHQKSYNIPSYDSKKDGPDHNPRFKATVIVNGVSFVTPWYSKSSKEAQNEAAKLAFEHFTGSSSSSSNDIHNSSVSFQGSSNASMELNNTHIAEGMTKPRNQEISIDSQIVKKASTSGNEKEERELLHHLYKSQLQNVTQKRNLNLPEYSCVREGPPHALRFKATVTVDGKTFGSAEFFNTVREAENAAAKVALMSLSSDGIQEDGATFYKNLLQDLIQKEGFSLPIYKTITSGASHLPTFTSTVEIEGEIFSGNAAKTKKQAEMSAAKVAWCSLKERTSCPSFSFPRQETSKDVSSSSHSIITVDLDKKRIVGGPSISTPSIASNGNGEESTCTSCPSFSFPTRETSERISSSSRSIITVDLDKKGILGGISIFTPSIGNNGKGEESTDADKKDTPSDTISNSRNANTSTHNLAPSLPELHQTDSNQKSWVPPNASPDAIYSRLRDPFPAELSFLEGGTSSSAPSETISDHPILDTDNETPENSGFPCKKRIRVYPRVPGTVFPNGTNVLPVSDDKWVAVSLDCPKQEGDI